LDNSCSGISPSILNYRTQKDNPWAKSLGLALVFLTSWGIIYWAIAIGLPESV